MEGSICGVAEFERSLILARTGEGRVRAIERGIKFGRPSKLRARKIAEAKPRRANGEALADRPQLQRQPQHYVQAVKG
jgi:DNA invertase Pin-like site-specific DNA recombinase